MSKNVFQSALSTAVSQHRAIKLSELGKEEFAKWAALAKSVASPAYAVHAATHDAAGLPSAMVNADAINAARTALAHALRPVVAYVGNVSFAGMEGEALLDVNAPMIDAIAAVSWAWGWVYSDEAKGIMDEIADLKGKLSVAVKWVEYYAIGDNKIEHAKRMEVVARLEGRIAALKVRLSEATKKDNGKVQAQLPQDEDAFRKVLENVLNGFIAQRNAADFATYQAELKAKKAKRKARAAENRKERKDIEKKMAESAK